MSSYTYSSLKPEEKETVQQEARKRGCMVSLANDDTKIVISGSRARECAEYLMFNHNIYSG